MKRIKPGKREREPGSMLLSSNKLSLFPLLVTVVLPIDNNMLNVQGSCDCCSEERRASN